MKRFLIACALVLSAVPAFGQATTMPIPLAQWFSNAGVPLDAGGLCVFRAGTSTLATTYTTADMGVQNANPVLFDSAGRPASGGVFLASGESFKFVLKDFTGVVSPTCIPDTGVTIWTVDDIESVSAAVPNIDVPGTAGQSIIAGQVAYLSDGSGGFNAGQWYLADADFGYSSTLPLIGVAVSGIGSGSEGVFRISGYMEDLSALTSGADIYIGTTPGSMTATAPSAYVRLLGRAESTTTMVVAGNPRTAFTSGPQVPCGRLTLTTAVPVTVTDVTAATTVYYSPFGGCNTVSTYTGSVWSPRAFSEISLAVPSTTATMYDVFVYDNAGVLTLDFTAWTNDTTRATALVLQDGVYVKTGATSRLYVGSFRTSSVSGQTEDSAEKRFLYNRYRQVDRTLKRIDSTNSWGYDLAAYQQANASAANQVAVVVGIAENPVDLLVLHNAANAATQACWTAIGYDSSTVPVTQSQGNINLSNVPIQLEARLNHYPAIGYHEYRWLERATASGNTTWYGDNNTPTLMQSGLFGRMMQ